MKNKIPILLITHDRPFLLDKVLTRLIKFTDWDQFELWICDNDSTPSNKKVIRSFQNRYKHIKIFSQDINQISLIQNTIISKLKSDLYIKLDDDILVTENWYKGFIGVYERNPQIISIGSAVIPINGFGWIPFLDILELKDEFKQNFQNIELIQGCMEPASWHDEKVAEFLWNKSLDIDSTANKFIENQSEFIDYVVPHRYSIGAIIFSHKFWEKMGGWKIDNKFYSNKKRYDFLLRINDLMKKVRGRSKQNRLETIIKILSGVSQSKLGIEEEYLFNFSKENGYEQIVTTESIVFHFSFGPTEEYIMKNLFLDIKFY